MVTHINLSGYALKLGGSMALAWEAANITWPGFNYSIEDLKLNGISWIGLLIHAHNENCIS